MLSRLKTGQKVVGARQLQRALEADKVSVVYIATDADLFVNRRVLEMCRAKNVPVIEVNSMKALGEACGIAVGTASAGILR